MILRARSKMTACAGMLVAVFLGAGVAPAFAQADAAREPFTVFAGEILDGLAAVADGARLKVAIWPFDEDDVPISSDLASEFNARLLAALIRAADRDFVFVEREELRTIIEEITQTSVFDDVENPVAALVQSAKVDALIIGSMRRLADSDDVSLLYRAVRVRGSAGGEDLAATAPQRMTNAAQAPRAALSLDQASRAAAAHFREHAFDMAEVKIGGIQFQRTGVRSTPIT